MIGSVDVRSSVAPRRKILDCPALAVRIHQVLGLRSERLRDGPRAGRVRDVFDRGRRDLARSLMLNRDAQVEQADRAKP